MTKQRLCFIFLFLLFALASNLARADKLAYECEEKLTIVVNYSSDPSSLESKISLKYQNSHINLRYEPTLVDSKYTIYSNSKYQWWEFIEAEQAIGILFENHREGKILANCVIGNQGLDDMD